MSVQPLSGATFRTYSSTRIARLVVLKKGGRLDDIVPKDISSISETIVTHPLDFINKKLGEVVKALAEVRAREVKIGNMFAKRNC